MFLIEMRSFIALVYFTTDNINRARFIMYQRVKNLSLRFQILN